MHSEYSISLIDNPLVYHTAICCLRYPFVVTCIQQSDEYLAMLIVSLHELYPLVIELSVTWVAAVAKPGVVTHCAGAGVHAFIESYCRRKSIEAIIFTAQQ